ncbi:MAG TPA: VTC domain-containing protein [Ardenticatenaceae bacterium]|nr:VTC domain-containing protein [Ardenticatenaceae bacterium]
MISQQPASLVGQFLLAPETPQWVEGSDCWANGNPDLSNLLHRFEPIRLVQMDEVALLDRVDTKYVMRASELYHALPSLVEQYRVLDVEGSRLNRYQSLYFDSADLALYLRHHNGAQNRFKVRSRRYVESTRSFLEVKLNTNKVPTIK